MNLLKSIFNFKSKENENIGSNFIVSVGDVIEIIDKSENSLDDDEFYETITRNTLNEFEANEIYIFLPIVFAKLWLPNIKWHEEYDVVTKNGKEISKKYDETESYNLILIVAKKYFENNPLQKTIINIGGRSAEINAINKLLNDGGKIEDIKVTKTKILK